MERTNIIEALKAMLTAPSNIIGASLKRERKEHTMDRTIIIEALKAMLTAPSKDAGIDHNDIYEEVRGNYLNLLANQFFPELVAGNKLKFVKKFIDEDRLVIHDLFVESAFGELQKAKVDLAGLSWDDPDVYEIFYKQVMLPADRDFVKVSIGEDKKLAKLAFVWPDHGPHATPLRERLKDRLANLPPVRFTLKVLTKIKTFIASIAKAFKEMPDKIRGFLADRFVSRANNDIPEAILNILSGVALDTGIWKLAKLACEKFGISLASGATATLYSNGLLTIARGGITTAGWLVMLATAVVAGILQSILDELVINLEYYEFCRRSGREFSWIHPKYFVFGNYVRRDKGPIFWRV